MSFLSTPALLELLTLFDRNRGPWGGRPATRRVTGVGATSKQAPLCDPFRVAGALGLCEPLSGGARGQTFQLNWKKTKIRGATAIAVRRPSV